MAPRADARSLYRKSLRFEGIATSPCRAVPEGHTYITSTAPHPKITILYIATSISARGARSSAYLQ